MDWLDDFADVIAELFGVDDEYVARQRARRAERRRKGSWWQRLRKRGRR